MQPGTTFQTVSLSIYRRSACTDRLPISVVEAEHKHAPAQVFVTAQGRCLELAQCLVQGSGVLILVSPGSGLGLAARLNKYILYGDQVTLVRKQM